MCMFKLPLYVLLLISNVRALLQALSVIKHVTILIQEREIVVCVTFKIKHIVKIKYWTHLASHIPNRYNNIEPSSQILKQTFVLCSCVFEIKSL